MTASDGDYVARIVAPPRDSLAVTGLPEELCSSSPVVKDQRPWSPALGSTGHGSKVDMDDYKYSAEPVPRLTELVDRR